MAQRELNMAFPERLCLVLADLHQQVAAGLDLSYTMNMPDAEFIAELRIASLCVLQKWRVDAISDEDRIIVAAALADAIHARIERLFRGATPSGEAELVLAHAQQIASQGDHVLQAFAPVE